MDYPNLMKLQSNQELNFQSGINDFLKYTLHHMLKTVKHVIEHLLN